MMVPGLTLNSSPAFVPGLRIKDTVDSRWSCLSGHPCSAGGAGEPGAAPQQAGRRPASCRPAYSRRLHSAAGAAGKTSATRGPRPPQLCLLLFHDLRVHTRAPVCLPPHWPCCQLFSGSVAPSSPVRLPSVFPPLRLLAGQSHVPVVLPAGGLRRVPEGEPHPIQASPLCTPSPRQCPIVAARGSGSDEAAQPSQKSMAPVPTEPSGAALVTVEVQGRNRNRTGT
jgi:hypothetical protein